jgi:uncharacterized protein YabE (DUF348 family)
MKKQHIIILTLAVALIAGVAVNGILAKNVVVIDGENVMQVVSYASSVGKLIENEAIEIGDKDSLRPAAQTPLKDGMEIVIKRAVPFYVCIAGKVKAAMSSADTVGEALSGIGIELDEQDIVDPGVLSPVTENMSITVTRVAHDTVVREVEVPFETVVNTNDEMYKGIEKVVEQGRNGKKEETLLVTYHDGVETDSKVVDSKIIEEPKNRVIEKGTKDMLVTSRGSVRFKRAINMTATAYDATFESTGKHPGDPGYGITRSGTKVRPGVVAVDPKVIPLGTKLYVKSLDSTPDYGFASAEDTGGAIKGNKIDLYMESPEDVRKYGKRKVLVYILE